MHADMLPLYLLAFAFGACIGSFLNVCIARWPRELSVVRPPSRCPRCERGIRWYENIPLVSWVALRARCAGCALPISVQYPLVELTVAVGWVLAVAHFGPTLTALRVAIFGTTLFGIAVTDLKEYLIPDGFTVFGFLFLLASALLAAFLGETGIFAGPYDAFIGACVGAGAIAIAGWLGEVALGREAMGLGDVTLMAMVGAALGPNRALLTVFVGAFLGAFVFLAIVYPVLAARRARHPVVATSGADGTSGTTGTSGASGDADDGALALPQVPFGVFLAPAALLTLLWGDALIGWYLASL
jgi:leader peptidase (prepilin peptidase)/N-methyltransferase